MDPVGAHTHLRHDIAPALSRAVPATDANRMAVVLEWMLAVLSNQLPAAQPEWLERPVAIALSGTAAQIDGAALEFPEWGTQRASWRARGVTVGGDADYGARFLDAVNVV